MSSTGRLYEVSLEGEDISQSVISIDKFTDVVSVGGLGEISSAQIMLNSEFGKFLTTIPRVEQFSNFHIKVKSPYDTNEEYERNLILDEIMPQTEEGGGYVTTVQLYGNEWSLTKVKMTGHYYFITFVEMIKEIRDVYNQNRNDNSPELTLDIDGVPGYTVGIFDFGYETSCYKALLQVLARLRLPVAGGGASQYFAMRFEDDGDGIKCSIFNYGSRTKGGIPVTLNGKDIDTQYISETKQNVKGTVVLARGKADSGRYPKELALWSNYIEEFNNAPAWDHTDTYVKGALVRWKDRAWRAKADEIGMEEPGTSNVEWEEAARPFLNDFNYSPWTKGNAAHYKNLASTATGITVSPRRMGFPDSNLIVKDGTNYRNWVNFRIRRPEGIHDDFLLDDEIPNDTRVLVDSSLGNLEAPFNGNDKFGNPFKNSIAQYRKGEWIVIHNSKLYDECSVRDESRVYVFGKDPTITTRDDRLSYRRTVRLKNGGRDPTDTSNFIWLKMDKYYLGHDCFHQATSVTHDATNNHEMLENAWLVNPEVFGDLILTNPSAVRVEYSFREADKLPKTLGTFFHTQGEGVWIRQTVIDFVRAATAVDFLLKDSAYKYGWWATLFEAPFPRKKTSDAEVGSIFKQPVLDLKNLNYTSSGKQGWGHEDSEDLGQITGIHFLFKFQYIFSSGTDNIPFIGNLPFRVTMYDTEDNVWTADFMYRFLGDTQQVILPFSAFRIYRARNPAALTIDDIIQNILTPDLKVLEIFETRKIKMITLQWQGSYDDVGRYSPFNANRYFVNLAAALSDATPKFVGWFDAVGFIKAPMAQAVRKLADDTDDIKRHIMPNIKDYPNISSQSQLEKIAQAELNLAEFRVDDYTLKTTGKCDIRAGDGVFVHDEDIISDTYEGLPDVTSDDRENTKKLSVRKINYTVNASDGSSGFVRHITVQARINQP